MIRRIPARGSRAACEVGVGSAGLTRPDERTAAWAAQPVTPQRTARGSAQRDTIRRADEEAA